MSKPDFTFYPRPEAHSMKWDELLLPLRHAVRDLLLRLDGAVKEGDQSIAGRKEASGGEVAANCFLVYGERGTGKTTVLLSAKYAVSEAYDDFFEKAKESEEDKTAKDNLCESAKKCAGELKRKGIVWLDVLDMESLPLHANLLTTMLTRVRNALDSSGHEKKSLALTSILEEGADSARHKLDQLIKDATLMWEDIREPDTRNKANRQVAAADIYAQYRGRFQDAMETLSLELGRRSGRNDEYHPIVLPIDNIDRSTEHLYGIVKLAQMVACPHLWIVMAGDREDVENYLERAYWKELISIGEGAGGAGKSGLGGEDEALVMARRQAAAASHKLLPPSHRIEVDLVKPVETLGFSASSIDTSDRNDSTKGQTIYELLEMVGIPNIGNGPPVKFVEIFDARKHAEIRSKKVKASKGICDLKQAHLTQSARLGLQLPARGVIDLWQLVHWAVNDPASNAKTNDLRAETIARTMLRNIIAESKMSSEIGRLLQEKIICRDPDGATILNFREPNPSLSVTHLRASGFDYRVDLKTPLLREKTNPSYAVRSILTIVGDEELVIFSLERKSAQKKRDGGDMMELSSLVAGWLAVLHDIVMWAAKSWVVRSPFSAMDVPFVHFVRVSHEVVCVDGQRIRKDPRKLLWPAPLWNNFFSHDVFWLRWDEIGSSVRKACEGDQAHLVDYLPRVLAVGWVACVLDTFLVLAPEKWKPVQDVASQSERIGLIIKTFKTEGWRYENIENYEKDVMRAAANLYCAILGDVSIPGQERVFFKEEGVTFMRDWLEQKLPLLLGHLYVPMSDQDVAQKRRDNIIEFLTGKSLSEEQKVQNKKELDKTQTLVAAGGIRDFV
ncbi:hypothetical protein SFMTTN_3498 [Sulfuriferula multivorans]|uniref:Uncharacterized protein n=1 Tax=Sulfuriferula multivorans TaxID=1559896 RepID=A0A401JI13_9PROT|nr:ATP-binding protein [Sulfuriferula multivorans]GBL47656.1 hypothetical protein SFMTTN_3498 [Sulfuriferula multivorans]